MRFGVLLLSVMAAPPLTSFPFGTSSFLIGCFFTESFFARLFPLSPAVPFSLAIARLRWRSSTIRLRRKQDYPSLGPPDRLAVPPRLAPPLRPPACPLQQAAVKRQAEGHAGCSECCARASEQSRGAPADFGDFNDDRRTRLVRYSTPITLCVVVASNF